jgi:hypothetical protein
MISLPAFGCTVINHLIKFVIVILPPEFAPCYELLYVQFSYILLLGVISKSASRFERNEKVFNIRAILRRFHLSSKAIKQ